MNGTIPPFSQDDFVTWCPIKTQGQLCFALLYSFLELQHDSNQRLP